MTIHLTAFDAAEYIRDAEGQAHLLQDAFESGHAPYIKAAVNTVARARGIEENPRIEAIFDLLSQVGLKLSVTLRS